MTISLIAGSPAAHAGNNTAGSNVQQAAYAAAFSLGDVLVIGVALDFFNTPSNTIQSVVDTNGNTYKVLSGPTVNNTSKFTSTIYWAVANAGAASGANTVTVTFSANGFNSIELAAFTGFHNPVARPGNGVNGNSVTPSSTVVTSDPNALVVQQNTVDSHVTTVGGGATNAIIDANGANLEFLVATTVGTYTPTATQSASGNWASTPGVIAEVSTSLIQIGTKRALFFANPVPTIAVLGAGLLAATQPIAATSPIACTMAATAGMTATISSSNLDVGPLSLFQRAFGFPDVSAPIGSIAQIGASLLAPVMASTPLVATMSGVGALTAALIGAGALADTMAASGGLTASLGGLLFNVGPATFVTRGRNFIRLEVPMGPIAQLGSGLLQPAGVVASGGALSDTMAGAGTLTASLTGSGALTDTMAASGAMTASLTGAGALADTMAGTATFAATLGGLLFDVGPANFYTPARRFIRLEIPVGPITQLGTGLLQPTQPPASGAMTAAMNGVGGMAASLSGAGALADTMASSGTLTASLTGAGALADTMAGAGSFTAALSSTLFDVGSVAFFQRALRSPIDAPVQPIAQLGSGLLQPAGVVASAGALTDTMNGVGGMTATLAGSGALSDTMAAVGALTATPSGSGALSDTMAAVATLSANLSTSIADVGLLPAFQRALVQRGRVVTLSSPILPIAQLGTGLLQAGTPPPPGPIFATMNGIGGLSGTMVGAGALVDAMAGVAALTATLGGSAPISDTMAGIGALVANLGGGSSMTDTMSALGTMSGSLAASGGLSSTQAAIATFLGTPSGAGPLAATLNAQGGLIVNASVLVPISCTMAGVGGMTGFISGFPAGADSLRFRLAPPQRSRFKPGQSFRASLLSTSLGVLTDPPGLTATMSLPDGSLTIGVVVRESLGQWHADFLIPFTCPKGIGFYRWRSIGVVIGDNVVAEQFFVVEPLDF